jgi:cob(I)alamin adenosyltransferase
MKIYTRTGDRGETGLFGGGRVPKCAPRVEAYGCVDELNSLLGLVRARPEAGFLDGTLARLQEELFRVGAVLATAEGHESSLPAGLRPGRAAARWLERAIDRAEAELPPLTAFVLPGGSPLAASLHVARTACRRAERAVVALSALERVPPALLSYLNRASDLLFVLARLANHRAGEPETLWQPRKPRGKKSGQ